MCLVNSFPNFKHIQVFIHNGEAENFQ